MAKVNYISVAKKAAAIQIAELKKINKIFDKSFVQAVELIANCKGKVITAGIGKSGLIARKVAATLSSVGISSFFLNPSEANHGDLGQIDKRDLLLVFSYSGNTSEIANMLRYANRFNIKIIGVASEKNSLLLKASDIKLLLPQVKESDPTGMVPTTSTSITLLLGDCLAVALMNKMSFSKERFKVFHPGGNIGQALLLVKDIMITGNKLPLVNVSKSIYDAVKVIDNKKLGLVVVMDKKQVNGILTDGDARRGIKYYSKDEHLKKFMTPRPLFISESATASKALSLMNEKKITSLLVSSEEDYNNAKSNKKLKGLIHIHSLLRYGIK
jgi:arabinose-5-phosphate isomerase